MSIGRRVFDAIERMDRQNYEGALNDIYGAIEDTAAREYGRGERSVYKRFLHDNMLLITRTAGLGGGILNLNLGYEHPDTELDAKGVCTFESVIYHAVRCGLYHEGKLPPNIRFVPERTFRMKDGGVELPADLIHGFIIAVVVAPVNSGNQLPDQCGAVIGERLPVRMNALWGQRYRYNWIVGAIIPEPIERADQTEWSGQRKGPAV